MPHAPGRPDRCRSPHAGESGADRVNGTTIGPRSGQSVDRAGARSGPACAVRRSSSVETSGSTREPGSSSPSRPGLGATPTRVLGSALRAFRAGRGPRTTGVGLRWSSPSRPDWGAARTLGPDLKMASQVRHLPLPRRPQTRPQPLGSAAWSRRARPTHARAPGGTRTHTGRFLRPLPLPIGIPGRGLDPTSWLWAAPACVPGVARVASTLWPCPGAVWWSSRTSR